MKLFPQIGSDIPAIDADILDAALDKLNRSDCEMILGPAKDDGYYLVGLRKEVKHKLGGLSFEVNYCKNLQCDSTADHQAWNNTGRPQRKDHGFCCPGRPGLGHCAL